MLSDFVTQVHERVRQEGKTPVVWEEVSPTRPRTRTASSFLRTLQMALHHNIQLRNDTIVTVWISSANVRAVAEKGYRIIHAVRALSHDGMSSQLADESTQASDFLYLDCESYATSCTDRRLTPLVRRHGRLDRQCDRR